MQLLGEVEGLKESQSMQRQQTRSNSLNSYENLRAGYEPEGHAGTSSPNHSGYLSNPSSRKVDGMHSGYDGRRGSEHRISTVLEGDEELEEHEAHVLDNQFEKTKDFSLPHKRCDATILYHRRRHRQLPSLSRERKAKKIPPSGSINPTAPPSSASLKTSPVGLRPLHPLSLIVRVERVVPGISVHILMRPAQALIST